MRKYSILALVIGFTLIIPNVLAGVIVDISTPRAPSYMTTTRVFSEIYDSDSGLTIKPDLATITIVNTETNEKIVNKKPMTCEVGSCYFDWEIPWFTFTSGLHQVYVDVSYQANEYTRTSIVEVEGVTPSGALFGLFLSYIPFIIFIYFLQKMMIWQVQFRVERSVIFLERISKKAEIFVLKKISKKPTARIRNSVKNFKEFFVISPVSLDPYGIMKKLEHLIDQEKWRFKYFVKQVASGQDSEKQANIMMGLAGAMSLYQLMKLVRHFVVLMKKTKSQYLAMMLQMQLPFIERIAKALLVGTEALSNGWPVGDSIGPYVTANLIDNSKTVKADEDTIVSRKRYKNRDIIIIKARGPGGRTGNPGRVLEKIAKKEKIVKIITIDAAAKLEGEKTGSIAEGVGAAIGGIGVERSYIEEIAVKKKIPLDSIVIKMSQEEAIMPMKKPVLNSMPEVMKALDDALKRTSGKGKIIVAGIGNTSGVGNNKKDADKAKEIVMKNVRRIAARKRKMRKRFKFPF